MLLHTQGRRFSYEHFTKHANNDLILLELIGSLKLFKLVFQTFDWPNHVTKFQFLNGYAPGRVII